MSAARLTDAERERFDVDGYVAPFTLCAPADMAEIRAHIEKHVLAQQSPIASCGIRKSRHLDDAVVFKLASHPAIIERAVSILGEDIVLWRSQFFVKNPGDKEIAWHHDGNFLPLTPMKNLSAWIAIDAADEENSCLHFVPGTHLQTIGHVPAPPDTAFPEMADPAQFDASRAVKVPLKPGQFVLFQDSLLHRSLANTSQRRRLALAVRMTHPGVRIDLHLTNPGQYGIVVRGEDRAGLNQYLPPPRDAFAA